MLLLNRQEVERLLDFDNLVEALATPMADLSAGLVSMPLRSAAVVPEQEGLLGIMSAYIPSSTALVTKLVSIFPKNANMDLPTHQGVVAVFDAENGGPLAIMDGASITEIRTAAASALATRILARPEASVLAVLGTGVQARAHARGIPHVRPVKEVRIVGRNEWKARMLACALSKELEVPVRAYTTYAAALDGADIVCATTHAIDPVVRWEWLGDGVHVNSVGLNPNGRELDDSTVANSLVVVESREAVLAPYPAGANDLIEPIRDGVISASHIHAEVGELISGKREGRTSAGQMTLYKSVGVAVQDAVAAHLVMTAARESGIGLDFDV